MSAYHESHDIKSISFEDERQNRMCMKCYVCTCHDAWGLLEQECGAPQVKKNFSAPVFEATPEQIEPLAMFWYSTESAGEFWEGAKPFEKDDCRTAIKDMIALPAFQEIIRAAQAEAWDKGFDHGADDLGRAATMAEHGEDENPYR